jgi:hypothetical protein
MKYFNVRYECLDARDDFAAQMKKGEHIGIFSNWDIYENLEVDIVHQSLADGDNFDCNQDVIDDPHKTGPVTDKRNKDMAKVEQIMHTAGWFDVSPNGPADVGDLTPVVPAYVQSGSDWKAAVQNKRQEVLEERHKNLPTHRDESVTLHRHKNATNHVKIVDKAYLSKGY